MLTEATSQAEQQALDTVLERFRTEGWEKLDRIDEAMAQVPQVKLPLRHLFTPGLYTRECFIPKGTVATTRIHLKEHPFVILKGTASVWTSEHGWRKVSAPFLGVTTPSTRRLIYAHDDVVWATFHVSDKTDPDEIAREVTYSEGKHAALGIAAAAPDNLIYKSNDSHALAS